MAQWWGREARGGSGGTSVVVKMESPDWAVPQSEAAAAGGKAGRGKNARQITWVLLLKAHRAAGKLTGAASAALSVAAAARRRVAAGRTDADAGAAPPGESPALRTRFYGFLRAFLVLSMLLLAVDVAAHIQGWHLAVDVPDLLAVEGLFAAGYASWVRIRLEYLAPALQFLANACVVLFLIQSADRLILCLGCLWIKLRGIKPVPNAGGKGSDDVEAGAGEFPMVLVQIPMCNEKELFLEPLTKLSIPFIYMLQVYQQSIGAVCSLDWPRSNFLVQVLDDSDDAATSALIKEEVEKWQREGVRILYRHRVIRDGYKAGNLKSAMNCSYVKDYEFVVIFDADFQPQPDFLKRTVPHFKIGFWKKFNLIFLFFLLRKLILPFYSFTLFCIILPMTMFIPEAELPAWVVCYIPATMSLLNILPAPKSFPFIVPYLLFENTMSVTKFNAMISGLFQFGSAYEWVVTKKSGRSSEGDLVALVEKQSKQQRVGSAPNLDSLTKESSHLKKDSVKKKHNRIYRKELALSFLLLTAAARSLLSVQGIHFYFLLFQGVSFLVVGLDLIGEQVE
ncbi:hypothetical protein HU200_055145 [Digitaria exilis]|uniref:Glycosyltransferase 2-like domain-containing protein n=1 Tax=Digitaria exilis TaxID=1010633 RepID=A0A835E3H6_9POAL|nr:hypothetical protein HU200_055145 [Digitaria exilis]